MQIVEILIGSPRKRGNSYLMSQMLVDSLNEDKFKSNISFLYDFEINPCVDCRACKKDDMVCILEDDMRNLYKHIEDADIIVIATPIYWFGPSAKAKLFLDRLRPYYTNKRLIGKQLALLLPAGTGAPDCDLTIDMFKLSAKALQMIYIGEVTAKAYDIGEIKNDRKAVELIPNLLVK